MSKKVLITGAGGYIGSIAADLFLSDGFEVVAIDNFKTGFKEPLDLLQKKYGSDKFRYYEMDLHDDFSTLLKKERGIEAVVHFAALIVVDESMKQPQKYFENNICGSLNLLNAIIANNIKKIVFSSTAAVYGNGNNEPLLEDHPTDPKNTYGESKLIVERIIRWYHRLLGLNYVIFRYFNVCGASEGGEIGYSKSPSTHLVANAVKGALGIEQFFITCPKVHTKDGTPIRDYVNVVDLGNAHLKAVNYLLEGGQSEVINLGTGTGNSVLEVVEKVQEVTGVKFEPQKTTPREGEAEVLIASIEKAKRVLNWQPQKTLADSINSMYLWYKKHPRGWSY